MMGRRSSPGEKGPTIHKDFAAVSSLDGPYVLPYAVLRTTAWPIETADVFACTELAREGAAIARAERDIEERREAFGAALYEVIPSVADRATRRYLLDVRRCAHGSLGPLPSADPGVEEVLRGHPGVLAMLAEEGAERARLAARRAGFERLHEAALALQLGRLRGVTAEPRFQRALTIANRPVAAGWLAHSQSLRPKRRRHLETTVFHYLMRACGRPTPNGAWAGVAPVVPADGLEGLAVAPAAAQYQITPNLQPFAVMLGALASQPRYRWGTALYLNPTLRSSPAGWRYEMDQGGLRRWVHLPAQPLLGAIVDAYSSSGATRAEPLIDALATLWPDQTQMGQTLRQAVTLLLDRDVLRCGPRLPPTSADAWSALDAAISQLEPPDDAAWRQCVARLRSACDRIGQALETLSAAALADRLCRAEHEIVTLWKAVGLEGAPPAPLLHMDMRAPFEVRWGPTAMHQATQAVEALLDFHAGDGGAEIFRRQSVRDVFAVLNESGESSMPAEAMLDRLEWQVPPRPRPVQGVPAVEVSDTLEFALGQMPPESTLGRRARDYCHRWEQLLETVHAERTSTVPRRVAEPGALPGPGGAVLLRPNISGAWWVGPGRPEAALFAARFASVLAGSEALFGMLREALCQVAPRGWSLREVVGWDPLNPNAGLHPLLTQDVLDAHSSAALSGLAVAGDPDTGRLWLEGSDGSRQLPMYATGAAIGYYDVCNRLLLVIGNSHGWEFPSFKVPALQAERTRWRHRPRLVLTTRHVLSPERWTLDRETLVQLSGAATADRYLLWRRLMDTRGIPDLVHARCGPEEPELLLRTDSPLALRCLLDGFGARAPWIELSELNGDPSDWPVRDTSGQHYLAELGVSWFAPKYWAAIEGREAHAAL